MYVVEKHDELKNTKPRKLSTRTYIIASIISVVGLSFLLGLILLVVKYTTSRKVGPPSRNNIS